MPMPTMLCSSETHPRNGDAQHRETLKHHDNIIKHEKVDLAWKFIYNEGHNVDSKAVECLLKLESLVPTHVSYRCFQVIYIY